MTEYIFLLLSIGLASVLAVQKFGHVVRDQTGSMAMELSGQHADPGGPDPVGSGKESGHGDTGGTGAGAGNVGGTSGGTDTGGGLGGDTSGTGDIGGNGGAGSSDGGGGDGGGSVGDVGGAGIDQDMTFSEKGEGLLKDIEKLRLKPYDDQTGKDITGWVEGATIGYGHLISSKEWKLYKDGITEEQAEQLFEDDLAPYVDKVNEAITVGVSQQQFDAMVLLTYNIGEPGFAASSVAKLVNDPAADTPYASLEDAWKAWNKSQGKVNQGLINRRNAEWNIYTKGVYETW